MGLVSRVGYGFNKLSRTCRRLGFAGKYGSELHVRAVNGVSRVVILLDDCTLERQAGEYAFGPRISQDLGVQLPVGSRGRVTSNWAGCNRSFPREFELARKKMLQAAVVHDQHDQVNAFDTDLQTPTAATNRDKRGSTPPGWRAAGGDASAVLTTNDKSALDEAWHDDHAICTAQHFFRDPLVGSRHDRVKNFHRVLKAICGVFPGRTSKGVSARHTRQAHQQQRHYFFHDFPLQELQNVRKRKLQMG